MIKRAMKRAHITQAELGRRAGIERTEISRMVTGHRDVRVSELFRIVEACGMEVIELIVKSIDGGLVFPPEEPKPHELVFTKQAKMTLKQREAYARAAVRAAAATHRAIRKGTLANLGEIETMCVDCGVNRATQYDHRDYEKPLEVVPVCGSCNMKRGPAKIPL